MKGILLVNLGSPDSPNEKDVKNYLDEFLMDENVIDYRWFFRALLVRGIILNTRPKKSAHAYKKIWTEEGSPLVAISKKIRDKLQSLTDTPIELAMRYANPSIEIGIRKLVDRGIKEIIVFPLYPQYAMSTTKSVMDKVFEIQKKHFPNLETKRVEPFYKEKIYIDCLSRTIKSHLQDEVDMIIFSYHGVPERHIYKTDPTKTCRIDNSCCTADYLDSHPYCYRHQCVKTTELVREQVGLPKEKVMLSFQSRLGKDKWIEPYTDETFRNLPKKNIKNIAVVSPAFVSDCLETLEEICMEGKKEFIEAGGETFSYIPCLNDEDYWIDAIKDLCFKS